MAALAALLIAVSACVAPPPRGGGGSTGGTKKFTTLPVRAALPSDATCASRVRKAPEVRPANARFNATRGHRTSASADPNYPRYGRVTGNFVGTTDEIIQWVACKWGIDEDVVRAQAAKETYWFQKNLGDFGTDASRCVPGHPIGADGRAGQCPESIGIMQVRYPYFKTTITDAISSTAYNLDLAYAVWRTCFEGEERWLNDVDHGRTYTAGDMWGCVGRWFAGRWYTQPALDYIAAVKDYVNRRIWQTSGFLNYPG
jgi:autotransporter family porin